MPNSFKSGDVVRLNSGGPKMTVVDYGEYGMGATGKKYLCRWFDEKNKDTQATFTEAELESVTKAPTPSGVGGGGSASGGPHS